MKKLNDIKGYWDMSYTYSFNDNDMWEGKILLEDDGWFEGIVVDPNSSYKEGRFVFGVYYPEKTIELFKFTPVSVSAPFVFHGRRDVKGYAGQFETIQLFGPSPCGVSHIITQDAELARGNVRGEAAELEMQIAYYKSHVMDDIGRSFYNNSIAMRNSLCQIVLRNYLGTGFTGEEMVSIMDECGPVNRRVLEETAEAAKVYVKDKISNNSYNDMDKDLPF